MILCTAITTEMWTFECIENEVSISTESVLR